MSPRVDDSSGVEWTAAQQQAAAGITAAVTQPSSPRSEQGGGEPFPPAAVAIGAPAYIPMTPPREDAAAVRRQQQSVPLVRRRSALKIGTSPHVPSPTSANKRRAPPRSISVNARSSSVVASEGMLFSRSELRPAPLSASRKFDSNVSEFRCHPTSSSSTLSSSSLSSNSSSEFSSASGPVKVLQQSAAARSLEEGGGGPPPVAQHQQRRDNLANLRIIEARRRAILSFGEPSSPPPPSLAALGSNATGSGPFSSVNGIPTASRAITPMPVLPEMGSTATAATTPTPRLHSNKFLIATAATATAATPTGEHTSEAGAPAAPRAAPLSAPGGRENARTRETLEQKWAAWQSENRGPAPLLGKPAPAPVVAEAGSGSSDSGGRGMFGGGSGASSNGGGSGRRWRGAEDFHDKVAFLGDYVANVFGRAKRMGVPQHCEAREVQYGVE
ncbi:unnamed protein product [Ectocarpus sp. CCAP 1310/34]|nr:unnamed protein product [Ectocarpus sp. CCAP 1310/34]